MRPRFHDEAGSLPMVLLVAIIIGGLIAALFTEVSLGQRTARDDRDMNQSIQVADAGMQAAFSELAALDYEDDDTSLPAVDETMEEDGSVEEGEFTWTARRVAHERWQVRSEGTYRGSTRALEATIGVRQLFPHGAYGDHLVELRGGNSVDSYDGIEWDTGEGSVGSNGDINLRGNAMTDWVVRYGDATYNGGGEIDEGVEVITEPAVMPNLAERAYAEGGACHETPADPYTADEDLEYGNTYCFSNVEFPAGDNELAGDPDDGPVIIYIAPSGNLELKGQGSNYSRTNLVPDPDEGFPDSSALQIYLAGGEVVANNHSEIAAAIHAPTSVCSGPNAQGEIYGSLVCRTIENRGGWEFHYDERLAEVTDEEFDITNWREELMGTTSFDDWEG